MTALGTLGHRCATWLIAVAAVLAMPSFAQAPRVPIEATGASAEAPAGWTLVPATGSPPVLMFHLCDAAMPDVCAVQGEMSLSAPLPDTNPVPLQELFRNQNIPSQAQTGSPELTRSGQFAALESRWTAPDSVIAHGKAGASMLIDTPAGRFSCLLMTKPELIEPNIESWRRFCASLRVAP